MFICKSDVDFIFVYHSQKQLLAAVGATKQSSEIIGILWQIGVIV